MHTRILVFRAMSILASVLLCSVISPTPLATGGDGRVVLLGFDGADARTIQSLMAERPDDYPTFRRLAAEGTFAPLQVVTPPESPVSWAAINTGQNPAKTGVPGFVKRRLDPHAGPMPDFGHLVEETRPVEDFEHTPIPTLGRGVYAALGGFALGLIGLLIALVVAHALDSDTDSGAYLARETARAVMVVLVTAVFAGAGAYGGVTVRGFLPDEVTRWANPLQTDNFWDHAARSGVQSIVLDAAQAFDHPAPEGAKVLAGLGVPDARGGIGDWFIYTTDPSEFDRVPRGRTKGLTAGTVFRVDERNGQIQTRIFGPENFWKQELLEREKQELNARKASGDMSRDEEFELGDRLYALDEELRRLKEERTSVEMGITREAGGARIRIGDEEQFVQEGGWSDFYHLTFTLNPLLKVRALTRVKLITLNDPSFELFVNVLDIDPAAPPFWQGVSTPFGFSAELADACGPYETYGWSTATMPFKDGEVDPELLMEDVEFTLKWREGVTYSALGRDDWRLFMSVFSTTDRVQHMMYQFYDVDHPLHDPVAAAREIDFFGETIPLSEAIPAIYRQMDRVVGQVLDHHLAPGDTLLVCADHGFQSFRRQVHINNWLHEAGYLALKPSVSKARDSLFAFVDWENTRAYSLGLGFIYLNLKGREANGIVAPSDKDALLREIRAKLIKAVDAETGARLCNDAYVVSEVHSGAFMDQEADLITGFAPPHRISWKSTFGGLHVVKDGAGGWKVGPVCSDNDSPWSGGHVSMALPDVAAAFFSNRRVEIPDGGISALQIAPTMLELTGVGIPAEMDLGPLGFSD